MQVSANEIYLETYVLQQDMRIRMPKAILTNMGAKKGITKFDIFYNVETHEVILREHDGENNGQTESN